MLSSCPTSLASTYPFSPSPPPPLLFLQRKSSSFILFHTQRYRHLNTEPTGYLGTRRIYTYTYLSLRLNGRSSFVGILRRTSCVVGGKEGRKDGKIEYVSK